MKLSGEAVCVVDGEFAVSKGGGCRYAEGEHGLRLDSG
jgi:hypothetical protein